jgi:hypothetical protein
MQKILFNEKFGLQQAVLNKEKTMTRREVKFPQTVRGKDWGYYHFPIGPVTRPGYHATVELLDCDEFHFEPEAYIRSQYAVGELVAIAMSYKSMANGEFLDRVIEGDPVDILTNPHLCKIKKECRGAGWKNKMYVKAELMPKHIRIKSVRAQKLQAISEEDCYKEGIYKIEYSHNGPKVAYTYKGGRISDWKETPQEAFADLIDKTCGKGTWNRNPLVYVYEFELED